MAVWTCLLYGGEEAQKNTFQSQKIELNKFPQMMLVISVRFDWLNRIQNDLGSEKTSMNTDG